MKKIITILFSAMFIFMLTGCLNNSENNSNNNSNGNNENQGVEKEENKQSDFVPQKALPDNLPVYPNAILWSDNEVWSNEGTRWMWLFNTTGSANEIVDFFVAEFQNLGFTINPNYAFANYEEFSVSDTTGTVSVGWLDDGIENVNPDTPGRGYMILVNLDGWNNR